MKIFPKQYIVVGFHLGLGMDNKVVVEVFFYDPLDEFADAFHQVIQAPEHMVGDVLLPLGIWVGQSCQQKLRRYFYL